MTNIRRAWWMFALVLTGLWALSEPALFTAAGFIPIRNLAVQYSGVIAIGAMSIAMLLALRPRWPEHWLGGLDKMYRLHKWLGITALVMSVLHWVSSNVPKWAVQAGLLERGQRPPRAAPDTAIQQLLSDLRHPAEFIGEWTFYAAALLIVAALVKWFPYRLFAKTHRLLAVAYLLLVFHTVVLAKFSYWTSPVGLALAPLLAGGTWAAVVVLLRRVGANRKAEGRIAATQFYPGVHALEFAVDVPRGWSGHKPGQFAFVTTDAREGAHPYTIASAWNPRAPRITFIVKELGDHTAHLRERLKAGQRVTLEGPYGCFTFEDDSPRQIWIGGGIGITPFVARMKDIAASGRPAPQRIHLFHPTAQMDDEAFAKLRADAAASGVDLHVTVDGRDGFLSGEKIRAAVPGWREASVWFCGPSALGEILKRDLGTAGLAIEQHFHQELFAMR